MKKCFRGWNFAENLIPPKGHFKHVEMKDHSTLALFSLYISCSEKKCNVEWGV